MKYKAFTLAELLIALAILGVIATFTIPKVLTANQNASWNAMGKETFSMISDISNQLRLQGTLTGSTNFSDFSPFINYVRVDTVSTMDSLPALTTQQCGSGGGWLCLKMPNGSLIRYNTGQYSGGTANTNGFYVYYDPDGKVTDTTPGSTNGPGKAMHIMIYMDGTVKDGSNFKIGSTSSWGAQPISPNPDWFSWN